MRKILKIASNVDVTSKYLGKYYFDFSEILNPTWPFDDEGVRLRPYPPPLFHQYHPMVVAEYALDCYRLYLETNNEDYKKSFLNNALWFVKNQKVIEGKIGLWLYYFQDTRRYNISVPFASAMSQGYGISLLLRAHEITGDGTFLNPAYYALNSYEYDVIHGGIRNYLKGHVFFEEAPSIPPSYIMNGFIFSLLGLYDLYRYEANEKAMTLFNEGIDTLKKHLHLYDLGYWSRYNLQYNKYLASKYYHNIHIIQLDILYRITNEKVFLDYSEKWNSYRNNTICLLKYYKEFYFYRYLYKLQRIKSFFESF
jgi:heparosan-N-sulfate-glucuronate 5-epimerase